MTKLSVPMPTRLDALAARRLGLTLQALADSREISIDLAALAVAEPFGMLHTAVLVRALRARGIQFRLLNADRNSYASHMGIYAEFDESFAPSTSNIRENERYIAIKTITRAAVNEEANRTKSYHVGETIEQMSQRFAQLLTQTETGDLVDALTYCIREILRNSYEHSGSDEVLVCAQFSPASKRVDLAFADCGSGVRTHLVRNPRVIASCDLEALKVSLLPGISGTDRGRRKRYTEEDPWINTGYGLFMTQRICREGGVFTISSGDALLRITGEHELSRENGPKVGTVVGLTIHLHALELLQSKLKKEFNKEARSISKHLKGANVSASSASLTLRMTPNQQEESEEN